MAWLCSQERIPIYQKDFLGRIGGKLYGYFKYPDGIENPKILVIGESGTGKTRAIKTLGNKGHYQVSDRDNGKGSVKLFN